MDPLLIECPSASRPSASSCACRGAATGRRQRRDRGVARRARALAAVGRRDAELDESEATCRRQQARFILREDLVMFMFLRDAEAARASSSAAPGCTASTGPAPLRDRLLATDRVRRTRLRHRGGARDGAPGLRPPRRAPGRDPHGRRQRAQLEGRRARRLHARGADALRREQRPPASRAARASMRACAGPRNRWAAAPRDAGAARARSVVDAGAGREAIDRVGDDAVDAEGIQPARLGRVVHRVDQGAHARRRARGRASPHRRSAWFVTTATQPSASASSSQPVRSVVEQQAARQRAARPSRAPSSAAGWNDVRSGGVAAAARARRRRGDDAAGLALVARRRLDLDVEHEAVAQAVARDRRRSSAPARRRRRAECQPPASRRESSLHGRADAGPRPEVVRCSVASWRRKGTPSADSLTSHSKAR